MDHEAVHHFLDTDISLQQLDLILVEVPQKSIFTSAIGTRQSRLALIIRWVDADGAMGYGECSCRPDPFYSHEFVAGAVGVVKDYIYPLIKKASSYRQVLGGLSKIRGWNFTKAAVEFALNDMLRRKAGKGILEASQIAAIERVPVGISLGLFENVDKLEKKLSEIEPLGYQRLKFKITKGYGDLDLMQVFRELQHANISFDANGAFDETSFEDLHKFALLNQMIEQPYPPSQLYLHQLYIQKFKDFKMCLDEEIESYGDLVSHSLDMQQLNIKPGRVGGLYNTLQIIDFCNSHGLDAWIGGMFETGIGRALNLQVAALLPQARAHDLSPSDRYFTRDLITEPIAMENGFISKNNFKNVEIDHRAIEDLKLEEINLR